MVYVSGDILSVSMVVKIWALVGDAIANINMRNVKLSHFENCIIYRSPHSNPGHTCVTAT